MRLHDRRRHQLLLVAPRKTSIAGSMGFNRVQTVANKFPKHVAPTGKKAGYHLPLYFIFTRKRMNPNLIKDGSYMRIRKFIKYLEHFQKFNTPTIENPVLLILILDNYILVQKQYILPKITSYY